MTGGGTVPPPFFQGVYHGLGICDWRDHGHAFDSLRDDHRLGLRMGGMMEVRKLPTRAAAAVVMKRLERKYPLKPKLTIREVKRDDGTSFFLVVTRENETQR